MAKNGKGTKGLLIEVPGGKPDWSPDKVGENSLKEMEEQRNNDMRLQQMNKPAGI